MTDEKCKQLLDKFIEEQKTLSRIGSGDDEFYASQIEEYVNKQRKFILDLVKFVMHSENERVLDEAKTKINTLIQKHKFTEHGLAWWLLTEVLIEIASLRLKGDEKK